MAAEQLFKRRNLTTELVETTNQLTDAVYRYRMLIDEYFKSGMEFQETDFSEESLQHLDVASTLAIITSATALNDWLVSTNHLDNLMKARR
jgi:hypothetical protein